MAHLNEGKKPAMALSFQLYHRYHPRIFIASDFRGTYQKTFLDVNLGARQLGRAFPDSRDEMRTISKLTIMSQHNANRSMETHCILQRPLHCA